MSTSLNRRNLLKQVVAGSAAIAAGLVLPDQVKAQVDNLSSQPIVSAISSIFLKKHPFAKGNI